MIRLFSVLVVLLVTLSHCAWAPSAIAILRRRRRLRRQLRGRRRGSAGRADGQKVILIEPGQHIGGLSRRRARHDRHRRRDHHRRDFADEFYERSTSYYTQPSEPGSRTSARNILRGCRRLGRTTESATDDRRSSSSSSPRRRPPSSMTCSARRASQRRLRLQRLDLTERRREEGRAGITSIMMESGQVFRGQGVHRRHLRRRPAWPPRA